MSGKHHIIMDWPLNTPEFEVEDLDSLFSYRERPQQCKAVGRNWGNENIDEKSLKSDGDLRKWLEQAQVQKKRPGLSFILASCNDLDPVRHNPAHLQKLPFTYEGFQQIVTSLPLHGDTARIINRSDMPVFEDIDLFSNKEDNIYYCCRTSGRWAGDLAVSCAFNPKTGFTSGVVFGCSDDIADEIAGRVENSENSWLHPLLMIGILVEIEKTRHMKLVEDHLFKLLQRVKSVNKSPEILPTSQLVRENYSMDLWIEVNQLKIALNVWRLQLSKMDSHILALENSILGGLSRLEHQAPSSPCLLDSGKSFESSKTLTQGDKANFVEANGNSEVLGLWHGTREKQEDGEKIQDSDAPKSGERLGDSRIVESWETAIREEGRRTQKRLKEIMDEYDCKIRECSMVLDGVTLSVQLSWNQIGFQDTRTNMKIASATRQDGNQMRLIALLTMIFLPATFLASLFSMTFFKWDAPEGEQIVSPYVWIYPVVVVTITGAVVGAWYYLTKRRRFFDTSWGPNDKV